MNAATDLSHFDRPAALRDGTPIHIRAIRPDDVDKVVAAFHKLAPESIYTRFFVHRRSLTDAELARLKATDFVNSVVLAVTLGEGAGETVIGGASYHVGAAGDGARVAEVAFTIEEDYQGQGLASRLLGLLTEIARSQGIARFEADVLAANQPMLSVFQRSGLPMTRRSQGGVVHLELDLAVGAPAS